jgi:NADH-quinone oxidoreductase subunit E
LTGRTTRAGFVPHCPALFLSLSPFSAFLTLPMTIPPALDAKADEYIGHYPPDRKRSAVLPLLHLLQHEFRFISEEAIDWVAQKLGIAKIDVLGVVTFYPGFRQTAPGKYHLRVCRTLSCAMAGSYELMESLCKEAGIDRSHADHHHPIAVSPDGRFSIEFAECLASCGTGPVCMVEDDFYEKVDPTAAGAKELLDRYRNR